MSVKIMGKVWDMKLGPGEKLVLLALADHADHDGDNAYPGNTTLAEKTGLSIRQVRRILDDLEAAGRIIKTGGGVGRGNQACYTINTGKEVKTDTFSEPVKVDTVATFTANEKEDTADTFREDGGKIKGDICDIEKGTFATIKGDMEVGAYKEEPSLTVHEPSKPAQAPRKKVRCPKCPQVVLCLHSPTLGTGVAMCPTHGALPLNASPSSVVDAAPPAQRRGGNGRSRTAPKEYNLPDDEYCVAFILAYEAEYQVAYVADAADVQQYERLLQRRSREVNGESWQRAVKNFFATPRNDHRMRELASMFQRFQKSALDKFGHPVEAPSTSNGNGAATSSRPFAVPDDARQRLNKQYEAQVQQATAQRQHKGGAKQ